MEVWFGDIHGPTVFDSSVQFSMRASSLLPHKATRSPPLAYYGHSHHLSLLRGAKFGLVGCGKGFRDPAPLPPLMRGKSKRIGAASKGILVGDNDSLEFQSGGNPLSVSIQIARPAIDTTVLAHRYGAADTFLGIILDIQDRLGSANSWIPTRL